MKRWLILKLGGFPDFDAALAHVKSTEDLPAKHRVLTEAVAYLFNAVGPEDVLRRDTETGMLQFRGKPVSEAQEQLWRAEAKALLGYRIWHVVRLEIRWQLQKKMFDEASITEDVVWGKLLTFYDDVIKTVLQRLRKGI